MGGIGASGDGIFGVVRLGNKADNDVALNVGTGNLLVRCGKFNSN